MMNTIGHGLHTMFSDLTAWYRRKTTELPEKSTEYSERQLLKFITSSEFSKEDKDPIVAELIGYIQSPKFKWSRRLTVRDFVSPGGHIRLCDDIMGYEVKLLSGKELLDCKPSYYNLTYPQAKAIYDALAERYARRNIKDDTK